MGYDLAITSDEVCSHIAIVYSFYLKGHST